MPNIEKSRLRHARFRRAHGPSIVFVIFTVFFFAMAGSSSAAFANSLDMQNCYKDDDQSFAACNKIIDDPTSSQHDRSQALVGRGDSLGRRQARSRPRRRRLHPGNRNRPEQRRRLLQSRLDPDS